MGLLMLPTLLLPRVALRAMVRLWSGGNQTFLRLISGIRVEIRGRANLPQGAAIIASKHQSEWESNVFLHLLRDPVYIMKMELSFIPLYGLYARRMGMIFIDRRGHAKTLRKLVQDAAERTGQGRSVVIFPEGTRVAPGQRLPYRTGVAALYAELGLPCVPVVHNSGLYWPKRSFRRYPGTIVMEFLPAIPPGLERHEFMLRLEETMETASARLYVECGAKRAR
jgi:1-acyl-sn-glycerol-3-phosphate acyltransferase